jgi:hypothetical protein
MPALDPQVRKETFARASKLTTGQVLDELKEHGITSLRELVEMRLKEINALAAGAGAGAGEEERGSILLYKCFLVADWG